MRVFSDEEVISLAVFLILATIVASQHKVVFFAIQNPSSAYVNTLSHLSLIS